MCCFLPVALSSAITLTIPLASMSKVTSICRTAPVRGRTLVGVDAFVRLFVEEASPRLLHRRHTRLAADQDHLVDIVGPQPGIGEGLLDRADRAVDQVAGELLELGAREGDIQ